MTEYHQRKIRCYEFEYAVPWDDIISGMSNEEGKCH